MTACLSWTCSTDLDAGFILLTTAHHCWLQEEYLGHISGLQALLCKGQKVAAQDAQNRLSSKTAEIAAAKQSSVVFQQAASLSESDDGHASMMRECARVSQILVQLQEEEGSLKLQLSQNDQQYQTVFGQQVLHDLDAQVCDQVSVGLAHGQLV